MINDNLYEELRSHIGAFILKHKALENEYSILKKEIVELKEELVEKDQKFKDFQKRENLTNIVTSVVGEETKGAEFKHKINEYIKEIDRCIIHLKQ